MTEKERMLKGELYNPGDKELVFLRRRCHKLCREYNTLEDHSPRQEEILNEMELKHGRIYLQAPIYFDYGCFITIGDGSYANFNFTVLDTCPVTIGKNVFMGVNVTLATAMHAMHYLDRNQFFDKKLETWTEIEYGAPITIEDNCWICSNVIVCGGVTIGEGSVIGAGSVVLRDIPKNSFAAGNPCRVIRPIDEKDREKYKVLLDRYENER